MPPPRSVRQNLEGFARTLFWRVRGASAWEPESSLLASPLAALPEAQRDSLLEWDSRAETPMQRMQRLSSGSRFGCVPGYLLRSFVEDRRVTAKIEAAAFAFTLEGKRYEYLPDAPEQKIAEGTELIGHFSPFDMRLVHLSDGQGRFVGTWRRFGPFRRGSAEQQEGQRVRRAYLNYAVGNARRRHAPDIDEEAARREDALVVLAEADLIPSPAARSLAQVQAHCNEHAEGLRGALQSHNDARRDEERAARQQLARERRMAVSPSDFAASDESSEPFHPGSTAETPAGCNGEGFRPEPDQPQTRGPRLSAADFL